MIFAGDLVFNPSARTRRALCLLIALGTIAISTQAQSQPARTSDKKQLTPGIVFDNEGGHNFGGSYATGLRWLDAEHYQQRRDGKQMKINARTDAATPIGDEDAFKAALLANGQFSEETAEKLKGNPGSWNKNRTISMLRHEKRIYLYRVAEKTVTYVTDAGDDWKELSLSPDGGRLAYVKDNDLYVIDAKSKKSRRLTKDGSETILNGILDWVYQEEIYGRGNWRGYWWRDDGKYIAYFRLDETQVPIYRVIDPIPYRQNPENWRYPKAGDPNPTIRVGIARSDNGDTTWLDLDKYKDVEPVISQMSWSPDGKLIYSIQDREQIWMDVNAADPGNGRSTTLFREQTAAFVENTEKPRWQDGIGFLWLSDRDGYKHIYFYANDGKLVQRITDGSFEVKEIEAVDPLGGWVYYSAEADGPFHTHLYRVPFAGGPPQRLTEPGFNHSTQVSPDGGMFIDTYSNSVTPPRVALRNSDGTLIRQISDNPTRTLDEFSYGKPEFLRIPARDGYQLNAMVIRPADYDPSRKYPVWCPIYAGPHAPTIQDNWSGGNLGDHLMATEGAIVWRCDPRSASGDSSKDSWHCYMNMGPRELADIEDGVKWLIAQGGVDESRIGIEGHSYGGYMTCYALTHSTMFKCGIAGAPVTDWRNYDSIYTERYMRMPKNNEQGYKNGSVLEGAANLHGRLLIAHGLMDENVHMANTAQFIRELQKNRKQFDLMLYPKDRHGFGEGGKHWRDMRRDFMQRKM